MDTNEDMFLDKIASLMLETRLILNILKELDAYSTFSKLKVIECSDADDNEFNLLQQKLLIAYVEIANDTMKTYAKLKEDENHDVK